MFIEKRTYQRNDLMAIVQYAPLPNTSDTVLKGVIKNYSNSGLCLIAQQPLEEGQEIIVNSIVVPSSKRATVRWQQNIDKSAYKVGLEFRR
jgi:c-di-GMP-binding flagellar brake protein YcgR